MNQRIGMFRHSGRKIRTLGFLVAMIPVVMVLGLLTWLLAILTSPVTLVGMLAHRITDKRTRLKKKRSDSPKEQTDRYP